ncbi:RnfH family protein [Psychromonas sp. MME2]|uniref:RnfH family protein n=1 Tax=unclassified Psychromonas TaxID=2614957 RepID=UPI00339C18F7
MKLSIAYAAGSDSFWQELELAEPITLAQAIAQSKFNAEFPNIDVTKLKVGIFGKACPAKQLLKEGDRVEIYHPVIAQSHDDDDDD